MRRLRTATRKPVVLSPVFPNVGVQTWYQCTLDQLISQAAAELPTLIAAAWAKTPPLFHNSHITAGYGDAAITHAAGVIYRVDDVVLLVRRTDGQGWAFPGGTIEENETSDVAARREAFEETLHPVNGALEFLCTQDTRGVRFATFIAEVLEPFTPTLNSEHDAWRWESIESALRLRLHPGARQALKKLRIPALAQDAPSPTKAIQAALNKWGRQTIKRFDLMSGSIAADFTRRSSQATQIAMASQLKKAGFTVEFKPTFKSMEALRAVMAENIALIKSIPRKYHADVEQKVWNAVRNGSKLHQLSTDLRKSYGITARRAALIARDQNAKAKAVIERVRQQELGITRGIWMHSGAGKEPRPLHVKWGREHRQYNLAKGMWDSDEGEWVHPGELINCKCTNRPVIEGFGDIDEADEPPSLVMLEAALENAMKFEGRARAGEMNAELRQLVIAKKTWIGPREKSLLARIERHLKSAA